MPGLRCGSVVVWWAKPTYSLRSGAGTPPSVASRAMTMRWVILLAVVAVLAIPPASASADVTFQVKGKWVCNNRGTVIPLARARVELWRDVSFWFDDKFGAGHTASDGSFSFGVRAGSNFDLYAKLVLTDDDGVRLSNWYSLSGSEWSTETSRIRTHSGTVDLGAWQISRDNGAGTPKCAIWQGAHNAYANYRQVIGSRPPDTTYSISADFPCCGTPFTTTDTTRWPSGYQTGLGSGDQDGGFSVNFHEFAHSVRHSFDGSFLHFLGDVAAFQYPQNHTACKLTNPGFAFNEGWAEYWAHTLQTCGDGTNFSQEGNVATALDGLEKCANRPTMVRVLRENAGSIHSYDQFRAKFFAIVGPRACTIPPVTGVEEVEPSIGAAALIHSGQDQIAAQKRLIAQLTRDLSRARRSARTLGSCTVARRCRPEIEKVVEPIALDARIAQAKLVLGRLEDGLATARRMAFMPEFSQRAMYERLDAQRASYERASQAIVIDGLKRSMDAIDAQPRFARVKSTPEFNRLGRRLSLLTSARKRRLSTPTELESLLAAPAPPVDVVRRTAAG